VEEIGYLLKVTSPADTCDETSSTDELHCDVSHCAVPNTLVYTGCDFTRISFLVLNDRH